MVRRCLVRYCVRTVGGNRWYATAQQGVVRFDDVKAATLAGVEAGESFYVQGDSMPFERRVYGLSTGSGFVMVDVGGEKAGAVAAEGAASTAAGAGE